MTEYRFVHPVDSITMRGNKLFGEPGAFGETTLPPRPSVLSGAFRSLLLSSAPHLMETFASGGTLADRELARILGTPEQPGDFALTALYPACRTGAAVEALLPLPADLSVTRSKHGQREIRVARLEPQAVPERVVCGYPRELPFLPAPRQHSPSKPESGWLLTPAGIAAYLSGGTLNRDHLVRLSDLWAKEVRIGVGIDAATGTAAEGKLFSVEVSTPRQPEHRQEDSPGGEVGFLIGIAGTGDRLPASGLVRLGGDGRAASFSQAPAPEHGAPLDQIAHAKRFKLVLHTPGWFAQGWLPDAVSRDGDGYRMRLPGLSARLACAAVSRAEVISGWDLARWEPKPAERVAPAGSVYWFDQMDGNASVLGKLAAEGLWAETLDNHQRQRRAEGYNRVLIGAW